MKIIQLRLFQIDFKIIIGIAIGIFLTLLIAQLLRMVKKFLLQHQISFVQKQEQKNPLQKVPFTKKQQIIGSQSNFDEKFPIKLQVDKINIGKIKKIKKQLEAVYPYDKYFLLRLPKKPYTVITSSLKLFTDIGGISCWVLSNSHHHNINDQEQNNFMANENSILETQDGSLIQSDHLLPDNQALAESIRNILNTITKKQWVLLDEQQNSRRYDAISQEIYNQLRKQYQRYSVTVLITDKDLSFNRWVAVWSAMAQSHFCTKMKIKNRNNKEQNQIRAKEICFEILAFLH